MASIQKRQAEMDSIILSAPTEGGWYVYSNHQAVERTNHDGTTRVSYVADAEFVLTNPA